MRSVGDGFLNKVFYKNAQSMSEIPNETVDLIVTSPPYFNIKDYAKDGYQQQILNLKHEEQLGDINDYETFISELLKVWLECERILKPNGKLVINAPLVPMKRADYSTHHNRHIFDLNADIQYSILHQKDTEMFLYDVFIWERTNPSKKLMFGSYPYPRNFYAQNTSEFVTVYVKDGEPMNRIESKIKEESKLTEKEWVKFTKQIWRIPIPGKNDIAFGEHSALMPEEIVYRCVRLFTYVGDVVLDPFAGSGTTLKVAKENGRNFVGYEIMDSYKEIIDEKIRLAEIKLAEKRTAKIEKSIILPNEIYHMDCFKFLNSIDDGTVNLAIIDPPYNMQKAEWDSFASQKAFFDFTYSWIDELIPKLQSNGSLYIFNTPYNSAFILRYLVSKGLHFQNWITWDKRDGMSGARKRFNSGQETILFFTKGRDHTFNCDDVRVPYQSTERIEHAKKNGILKNGKRWFPNSNGRLCGEVWHITSERHKNKVNGKVQKMGHATPKPLELVERIVAASSNENDLILDCFVGTGTTAIAAKKMKRNFLCCDLEKNYVELARKKLGEIQRTHL